MAKKLVKKQVGGSTDPAKKLYAMSDSLRNEVNKPMGKRSLNQVNSDRTKNLKASQIAKEGADKVRKIQNAPTRDQELKKGGPVKTKTKK